MTRKYQTLKANTLLKLITVNLQKILFGIRIRSKGSVNKCAIAGFKNNADLDKKVATLAKLLYLPYYSDCLLCKNIVLG